MRLLAAECVRTAPRKWLLPRGVMARGQYVASTVNSYVQSPSW